MWSRPMRCPMFGVGEHPTCSLKPFRGVLLGCIPLTRSATCFPPFLPSFLPPSSSLPLFCPLCPPLFSLLLLVPLPFSSVTPACCIFGLRVPATSIRSQVELMVWLMAWWCLISKRVILIHSRWEWVHFGFCLMPQRLLEVSLSCSTKPTQLRLMEGL